MMRRAADQVAALAWVSRQVEEFVRPVRMSAHKLVVTRTRHAHGSVLAKLNVAPTLAHLGISIVQLSDCSTAPLQQFQYTDSGQTRLMDDSGEGLCLTVASEAGEPTGGPSHLRRDLTLESCDLAEAARSRWTVGSTTVVASEP